MKRPRKIPARKTTKAPAKEVATTKEVTPRDAAAKPTAAPKSRDPRLPAVGATLDREYKGKTVRLKFLDDGVEVAGKTFTSLSAAARHITGAASINGFLWAGLLKDAAKPSAKATTKPAAPKGTGKNELATLAGQRAALEAAGIGKKKGRPISKPHGAPKADTPATPKVAAK